MLYVHRIGRRTFVILVTAIERRTFEELSSLTPTMLFGEVVVADVVVAAVADSVLRLGPGLQED